MLEFLGLPVPGPDSETWHIMQAAGPRVSNIQHVGNMQIEARKTLEEIYLKHNEDLAGLLREPKWADLWNRNSSARVQ